MQPIYIVAEPCTGKPLLDRAFANYDEAKRASAGVSGSIVTNAEFVASKGHKVPSE